MNSSVDSGHWAEEAEKTKESKCPKSPDGKHDWEKKGSWPSTWGECKHCRKTYFNK